MPTYPLTGSAAAEVEARLNIMRLAQTRLGYMNPTLRLTVNGVEVSTLTFKESIRITYSLDGPSTATLMVHDFVPVEGQEIKIAIGAITNLLFAGHIVEVNQIAEGLYTNIKYSLRCQDYTWLLDRRQVMKTYSSDNIDSIIADQMSNFTSGFTATHVQQGLGFLSEPTPFTMETVSGCFRRLAAKASPTAYWRIDPTKDLHFAASDRVPQPHDLTSAYKDYENVALSVDLSQVRNRVYVEGAGSTLTLALNVGTSPADLFDATPFASGGGDVRIGAYAPLGSNRMRYTSALASSGTNQLLGFCQSPDNLNADFRAVYPSYMPDGTEINVWVQVNDTASQTAMAALEGGDGIHETYIQDRRLNTDGATARGNAELAKWKNPIEKLTYRTHDPNTRPGASITASLAAPTSISGTFTIQSVTISAIEAAQNRHPWYDVVATSTVRSLWDIYQDALNKASRV